MAVFTLSEYGKFASFQNNSGSMASAPYGGAYLFASGAAGSAKLYLQNEGEASPLDIASGFDIDSYTELTAAPHATQDEFLVSDNGDEKRVSMTNLALGVFAVASDSGDVSYGADGELTIGTGVVEHAMLAGNCIDGDNIQDDVVNSEHIALGALDSEHYSSGSIDSDHLAGSIANAKLANSAVTVTAGDGLKNGGSVSLGSSVTLNIEPNDFAGAGLEDDGSDNLRIAATGVTNAMLAGSIANAKLSNSAVTVGSTAISLGASSTVLAGITQLTASNIQVTNLDVVTLNSVSQTETTLEISDKLIVSALSASSANSDGGGLRIGGGQNTVGNASILYDHNSGTPQLDFNIGGTTEIKLRDGVLMPETDSDVDLGTTGARFKDAFVDSITVTGEIDGASLDISGNADIDGTLEADAITVNGATLQVVVEDHVGAMLDGTETGISVSYDSTDNNLDFVIDAAQTAITSILATDLKIGEDDQTKIDFETADEIHFYAANAEQVYVANGVFGPQTDSAVALGADGVAFSKLYVDDIDLNGVGRIDLDADGDTSIRSAADDQIQFELGGSDRFTMAATGMNIGAGAGAGGTSLGVDGTGTFDGGIVAGSSNQGDSAGGFRVYGSATGEEMIWSVATNALGFKYHNGSEQADIMTLGGDANTDFAIEVANGSANINKIKAAAFVTYSDESLKSEVTSMANTALDTVMSLEGVEFTWKDSGERDFGFIAQDVQKVVPKAVHTGGDGVQGVDYSRLTSVLVEAVKAQQVQIEDLKKTITNLKK
jgi:hypothetical protein